MQDILSPDIVTDFLKYGGLSIVFGMFTVLTVELIAYGIVKALSFFRL